MTQNKKDCLIFVIVALVAGGILYASFLLSQMDLHGPVMDYIIAIERDGESVAVVWRDKEGAYHRYEGTHGTGVISDGGHTISLEDYSIYSKKPRKTGALPGREKEYELYRTVR